MEEETLDSDPQIEETRNEEPTQEEGDRQESKEVDLKTLEKRLKDGQRYITKLSQEKKQMQSQIDELRGAMSILNDKSATREEKQQAQDWLADLKGVDLLDNPDKIPDTLRSLKRDVISEIVKVLELRDKAMEEKISIYPEVAKKQNLVKMYAEEIAEYREENPDMDDVPDLAIAKIIAKTKPKQTEIDSPFQPSFNGRKAVKAVPKEERLQKEAERVLREKWGYTKENGFV